MTTEAPIEMTLRKVNRVMDMREAILAAAGAVTTE